MSIFHKRVYLLNTILKRPSSLRVDFSQARLASQYDLKMPIRTKAGLRLRRRPKASSKYRTSKDFFFPKPGPNPILRFFTSASPLPYDLKMPVELTVNLKMPVELSIRS